MTLRFRARRFALAAMALVCLAVALIGSRAEAARWVIPPGQEALAMRMLGGELPGGCRFLGASIEKTQVTARYACAEAETRIALRHPEDAPKAVAKAKQLAIVVPDGAAPPEALIATLAERVRESEGGWRWIVEGRSLGRSLAAAGVSERARRLVLPVGIVAALGFAAMIVLATRRMPRIPRAVATEREPKARSIAFALAVIAGAFAYLEIAYPGAPVHSDTTRDLLMAVDCVSGQACDHGPPTTLGVIVQGALWTRFLAFVRVMGWGVGATRGIVLGLHAISAGVLFVGLSRRFGRGTAIATAALYTASSALVLDVPILWNPSISLLPLVLFHAAVFELAKEDDARGLRSIALSAGAGLALALAVDSHVLFAVLAPPLFAAIAALSRRPAATLVAAAAVLVGTLMLDSRTAWAINGRALVEAGAAIPLAALIAGGVAAGAWSRSRLAGVDPRARALVFLGVAAVCTVGVTALLFAALGPAAGRRYLIPAVPALALGVAALGAWAVAKLANDAGRRAALGAALTAAACAAIRLGAPRMDGDGGFTLSELETAAREVYRRVPTHREVVSRVRARSPAVISALAIFEPLTASASGDPRDEWLLLKRSRASAPPPGPRLAILDFGRDVAVLAAVTPRLDRSRTTFCFAPRKGVSPDQGCVEARIGREPDGPTTPQERAYPALAVVRDAFPLEMLARFDGGVRQTIRIAFEAGSGDARVLALMDARSGYRIEGAAGAPVRGDLPGMKAVIEAGAGEVVLAREDGGEPKPDRYWPPPLLEAPEGDAVLASLLDEELGYSRPPRLPKTP